MTKPKTEVQNPLPPAPPLDESFLRNENVCVDELGELAALVPAAAPYRCADPSAPALVLVPGLGMDAMGYLRQLPLGALTDLHLFQTPNNPAPGETGPGMFARYVEAYILARKLDQRPGGVVLGGCSMGGVISLAAAIRGRVKLRGLVLIATFGSCRRLPRWQRLGAPLAWVTPFRWLRKLAWKTVARGPRLSRITKEEADWMVAYTLKRTQKHFGYAIGVLTRQEQLAGAATLKVPTLVVHGTRDRVLPLAAGQELARVIPGAEFAAIEDAGHVLHFTHPQPLNAAIARFLNART